ncbi:MAG: hypothetical protein AB7O50_13400 [Pseudolabrys sp.]
MAGRSDRLARVLLLGFVVCAGVPAPGVAEAVRGESRELGIKFTVRGGTDWCGQHIRVALNANTATALQAESVAFLRMIGRIRAVVLSQCPQIEVITFEGASAGQTVLNAEMTRLTKWRRFVTRDAATGQPICPPAVPQDQCGKQADAYLTAVRLFRGDTFADTEIINTLDAESDNLAFRSKDVIGKLRIITISELADRYPTAIRFADAIATDIAAACTGDGRAGELAAKLDLSDGLARRSVLCRTPGQAATQNVILVWNTQKTFHVFSLFAEGQASNHASSLAGDLIRAIQRQR